MKLLFVCLGNICRSPLAEYMAKDHARKLRLKCEIASAGTSGWHDGERMHHKSSEILRAHNIDHEEFRSKKLSLQMCQNADVICVMDDANERDVRQSFGSAGGKIIQLGKLIDQNEIADPWYTGDFERTYKDLAKAIEVLFDRLLSD